MDVPGDAVLEAEEVTLLRGSLNELVNALAIPALWTSGGPPQHVSTLLSALPGMLDGLAQRTTALAAANQDLLAEVAAWKRAEGALQEREHESRLIVDSIPGMVALLSASGDVEVVNQQVQDYFGQSPEELKQWATSGIIHPDDLSHVIDAFSASLVSGAPYDIQQRFRRSDGAYRWFQNSGFPLRDTNGQIVRWCVLLTDVDEHKHAEDALRASERESRLMVDSIPGMVLLMTATGAVEFVNRQILTFLGKAHAEMDSLEKFIHPDDRSRVIDAWAHSIATSEPLDVEHRVLRADDTYRWLHARGLPLRDAGGNIVRWYTLLTDIDQRRRAEDALRASERNLQLIIDTIPAMAWSARPDGSADYFNQHYLDFVGYSAEQASGWGWTAAVQSEDLGELGATWQRIMASAAPGEAEARMRRHDGEYRWFLFRANPLRDESGAIVRWYGVNTDIEDRKRAEAELRRAYDSFADAQRLSKTGNFTADIVADDHIWSAELYRIFEIDPSTRISVQMVRDVIHPEDLPTFDARFARSFGGVDFDLVFRIVPASGNVKHVHAVGHFVERVAGRPLFIGAIQDVTESVVADEALSRARAELAHVARVSSLSALTASIAHEVNQPLAGIITNSSTCLRMLDADPPNIDGARETVRRTMRDGNRASDVIARLRALFSKREFTLEPLDLNQATREVLALSATDLQRHHIVLDSELADDLPIVTGDRIQLQQVILNLLRNATDALVSVDDRPRHLLIRTEREDADRVRVSVRDTGVGIDPESMHKLFGAFYTTKSGGMGIGLFVSRSIIERHQGRLWAEPNGGNPGATFSFAIPHAAENIPDAVRMSRSS